MLGSGVAWWVCRERAPRLALLYGAVIGTLPDLDVLVPYASDLEKYSSHRAWSHSWLVQTAVAPLAGFLLARLHKFMDWKEWSWLVWLVLVTHSILDASTVYGTQVLWPLDYKPFMGGAIFIIDPLYTLPLLLGVLAVLLMPRSEWAPKWMKAGLLTSTVYLAWGWGAQYMVHKELREAAIFQGLQNPEVIVTAAPFNTLLWRGVLLDGKHYGEAWYGLLDKKKPEWRIYSRNLSLLAQDKAHPLFSRMEWFTHGYYRMRQEGAYIIADDLRMGAEPQYFFSYPFYRLENGETELVTPNRMPQEEIPAEFWPWLWNRVQGKVLHPAPWEGRSGD